MLYENWNVLDWILVTVAVVCLIRGLWRGGVSQIFGIAGVLGGFFLAVYAHENLAWQFQQAFPSLPAPRVVGFCILFFLSWFCFGMLGFWLSNFLRQKGLGLMDRVMGGGIGLGKAVVISVILVSLLTSFFPSRNPLLTRSELMPHAQRMAALLVILTPEHFRRSFEQKRREVEEYWKMRKASKTPEPKTKGTENKHNGHG
jgi:membrane protein required for colicin V production